MNARRRVHQARGAAAAIAFLGVLVLAGLEGAWAIKVQPSQAEIEQALADGKDTARARVPPARLYEWFGSTAELEPHGFLMTKLVGLRVLSAHFALRAETPTQGEIDRILAEDSLLISVVIFGERADFAVDSYLVLTQGDRTIKPNTVRFDGRASRSASWPGSPAYRAKIIASVPYAHFDPLAETHLLVYPGVGGEVSFELDLSQID